MGDPLKGNFFFPPSMNWGLPLSRHSSTREDVVSYSTQISLLHFQSGANVPKGEHGAVCAMLIPEGFDFAFGNSLIRIHFTSSESNSY